MWASELNGSPLTMANAARSPYWVREFCNGGFELMISCQHHDTSGTVRASAEPIGLNPNCAPRPNGQRTGTGLRAGLPSGNLALCWQKGWQCLFHSIDAAF